MKPIRFHPHAVAEMVDTSAWYESQQTDLGKRFLAAVQDALNRIEVNPLVFPVVDGDVRRCLTLTGQAWLRHDNPLEWNVIRIKTE